MKHVAVIEGDDASPEAVRPTIELIDSLSLGIDWVYPSVGETAEAEHGSTFPAVSKTQIDAADTTFFGSTSGSSAAALMYLRWGKQTFANVRPAVYLPGARSPLAAASSSSNMASTSAAIRSRSGISRMSQVNVRIISPL